MRIQQIRNFCIIAHIDHGKSTLADRLLQKTGLIDPRKFRDQMLDEMDLERERGITIKASAITIPYQYEGEEYQLNLIDTPGHVDFSHEVRRSLAACEGAALLVDAAQGIEAQTVANAYMAMEHNLAIIPVINKIDLPQARPDEVAHDIAANLGVEESDVLRVSAKTGQGAEDVLNAVIERVPHPEGSTDAPLRALIFDSTYNNYRGVILYVRVFDGSLKPGDAVTLANQGSDYEIAEVGRLVPKMQPTESLRAGEVGYCIANIRQIDKGAIGDTIIKTSSNTKPLPGYRPPRSLVFCGVFPADNQGYNALRDALQKLHVNDPSFTYEPETSEALGLGFRCGFLGLLHMEIVQERLERESGLHLVQTSPNVNYEVKLRDGKIIKIDSPAKLPDMARVQEIREPFVLVNITLPPEYVGGAMKLAQEKRGDYQKTDYLGPERMALVFEMPLSEIIHDFNDRLKSITRGYGAMDYEFIGYRTGKLVKLDILVAGNRIDAFSQIVDRDQAYRRGKDIVARLARSIPRHLFKVSLQAAIGGKIISREDIPAMSKNVTGKCYGGDITRKRKLLEKQKEGKKRLRHVGQVEIPQEAFLAVVRSDEEGSK